MTKSGRGDVGLCLDKGVVVGVVVGKGVYGGCVCLFRQCVEKLGKERHTQI